MQIRKFEDAPIHAQQNVVTGIEPSLSEKFWFLLLNYKS